MTLLVLYLNQTKKHFAGKVFPKDAHSTSSIKLISNTDLKRIDETRGKITNEAGFFCPSGNIWLANIHLLELISYLNLDSNLRPLGECVSFKLLKVIRVK